MTVDRPLPRTPGFRRSILIEPLPARVTAELEDDYHRMVVALSHHDGILTGIDCDMKRSPWTTCPGAMQQLSATFTGVAIADAARRGEKSRNCTHLYDLAVFACAHAHEAAPVTYDIAVADPVEGARMAHLVRNGCEILAWSFKDDRFTHPAELAGLSLYELGDWIARQDSATQEAARVLRWASILAYGRGLIIPALSPATMFANGTCYTFQPDMAQTATRRAGAERDFSLSGVQPMEDRREIFPERAPASRDGLAQ